MKFQLKSTGRDLAYRFERINKGSVSQFLKVINFLCNQLSYLLLWPDSGKPCLWIRESTAQNILLL